MNNCRLVPMEPTVEMLVAGKYALEAGCHASVIYADMIAAAPDLQGEPVAWLWGSSNCTTDKEMAEGFEQRTPGSTTPLYLHPQPAPDVAGVAEDVAPLPFWEPCNPSCDPEFNGYRRRYCANVCDAARKALAAYRKGGDL